MTRNRFYQIIFSVLLFIVSFVLGARVANNISLKRVDIKYQVASKDISLGELKVKLNVLKSMRSNDYAKAMEVLERSVDANLYSLAEFELVQKTTDKEIENVVRDLKSYRDTYKDHTVNPGFAKTINNLLYKYN